MYNIEFNIKMHYVTNFESRLNAEGTYRHRLTLGIKYLYTKEIHLISLIIDEGGLLHKTKYKKINFLQHRNPK
jgi:hypothetical protein